MKKEKMSLANIQGKLSRTEMKKVMAGSGTCPGCYKNRVLYSCGPDKAGNPCANSWCGVTICNGL